MEKSSQSKIFHILFFVNFCFLFYFFSVQDFLDSAKKDFEDRWSKNDKVRQTILFLFFSLFSICKKASFYPEGQTLF